MSTTGTNPLIRRSAAEQAAALAAGEVSSRELTAAHLERIEAVDGAVNAFLDIDAERALAQADAADAERAEAARDGRQMPELTGVPVAVKDLIVTRGQDPPGLGAALRRHPRAQPARRSYPDPGQDQPG